MTVGEVLSRARSLVAEPTDGFYTDQELLLWLNEGVRQLAMELPREVLKDLVETTTLSVDTTGECELPENFLRLLDVRVEEYKIYLYQNRLYYDSYRMSVADMNTCYLGELIGNKLKFHTQPYDLGAPSEVEIVYVRKPVTYTDLNDVLEIDDIACDLLPYYLASLMSAKDKESPQYFEAKFEIMKQKIINLFEKSMGDFLIMRDPPYREDWD